MPLIGPIRAALLVALLLTFYGFRNKRQLVGLRWFCVERYDSGDTAL